MEQAPYTPPEKEVTEEKVNMEEVKVVVTEPVQIEEPVPEVLNDLLWADPSGGEH